MNLRTKIILWMLPLLLPILVVFYLLFSSWHSSQMNTVQSLSQAVLDSGSRELNRHLINNGRQFSLLAKKVRSYKQIFGRDFYLPKLNETFESLDYEEIGFLMFAVIDSNGKVLWNKTAKTVDDTPLLPRTLAGNNLVSKLDLGRLNKFKLDLSNNLTKWRNEYKEYEHDLEILSNRGERNSSSYIFIQKNMHGLSRKLGGLSPYVFIGGDELLGVAGIPYDYTYVFATPIDIDGKNDNFLLGLVNWGDILNVLRSLEMDLKRRNLENTSIQIFDIKNNKRIARTFSSKIHIDQKSASEIIKKSLQNNSLKSNFINELEVFIDSKKIFDDDFLTNYFNRIGPERSLDLKVNSESRFALTSFLYKKDIFKELNSIIWNISLGAFFTSLFFTVLILMVSRKIIRPVSELADKMSLVSFFDFSSRIKVDNNDELGRLGNAFNKMMQKLYEQKIKIDNEVMLNKKAQKEKEAAYRNLQGLLETMPIGLVLLKNDGIIDFVNKTGISILELGKEKKVIGKNFYDFIKVIESEEPQSEYDIGNNEQAILLKNDGTKIPVLRSSIPMVYNEELKFLETFVDITAQKNAEKDKKNFQEQLFQAGKLASLGIMGAGIAHELNNPLTVVRGYTARVGKLINQSDNTIDGTDKYINGVLKQCDRMAKIVNHVREFSRESIGVATDLVSPNDIIHDSLILLNKQFQNNDISVVLDLQEDLPMFEVNRTKIESVFQNLLINSKDALDEIVKEDKEIKIRSRISNDKSKIDFVFKDNGPGISPDGLKKIFDPFFTTKDVGKGTGLGLSLTYGIVTEHNGLITVNSKKGKGTTFYVEIPISYVSK